MERFAALLLAVSFLSGAGYAFAEMDTELKETTVLEFKLSEGKLI